MLITGMDRNIDRAIGPQRRCETIKETSRRDHQLEFPDHLLTPGRKEGLGWSLTGSSHHWRVLLASDGLNGAIINSIVRMECA